MANEEKGKKSAVEVERTTPRRLPKGVLLSYLLFSPHDERFKR